MLRRLQEEREEAAAAQHRADTLRAARAAALAARHKKQQQVASFATQCNRLRCDVLHTHRELPGTAALRQAAQHAHTMSSMNQRSVARRPGSFLAAPSTECSLACCGVATCCSKFMRNTIYQRSRAAEQAAAVQLAQQQRQAEEEAAAALQQHKQDRLCEYSYVAQSITRCCTRLSTPLFVRSHNPRLSSNCRAMCVLCVCACCIATETQMRRRALSCCRSKQQAQSWPP